MIPRPKDWRYPYLLSEHAFDKIRMIDMTLAEFESLLDAPAEGSKRRRSSPTG